MQQPSPDDATALRPPEETPTVHVSERQARALQLTPGTVLGGRYRIVSLIGGGGMGEVYRADDLRLGQTVALKFLAHHGDSARLYEEVRIGRQISHPNVCRLYDIAEVDGQLFITMEFVDGEDLASLLRRIGRLPAEKALTLMRDICAGLAAAHDKGVIHRDLKPANVMVDGRGRARVTDFGLALAGGTASDTAGTPAYMAPEQLAGEGASAKSDIYALGLVLYEIFTGRRTFDATSTQELLARQQRADFTRPSVITRDVPTAVERIIVRCLDANPEGRPDSVEEILHELPGGDPLAAAIAAGETPSPAMVAAASERGELSAAAAWGLLSFCVVALFVYAALTSRTMLYRRLPVLKSPDTLADRVSEILVATRQPLRRVDAFAYFFIDHDQLQWKGRPSQFAIEPFQFYFRQSPRPMIASNFFHRVSQNDPPLIVPGMTDVVIDGSGRLVEFVIVPPQFEPPPQHTPPIDWRPFLALSGVNQAIAPAQSWWAAPVDSDEKHAWTIGNDGMRVEAAAYHGKPVWFALVPPWRRPLESPASLALIVNFTAVSEVAMIILLTAYMVAAALLAIRNLRRRQGDRRGATAIAIFIFGGSFGALTLQAHHPPDLIAEWVMLMNIAFFSASLALAIWLGYVAVEPLVRRRWPRMLIAWSRLLEGRLRDPMIGRDLLIGATAGVLSSVAWQITALAPGAPLLETARSSLVDLRQTAVYIAVSIAAAVLGGLMAATILLTLHVATHNLRLSVLIYFLACTVVFAGDMKGPWWSRATYAALIAAAALAIFFRFGLLALSTCAVPLLFLRTMPVTLDTAAWYFGRSLFALLFIAAVALYGFVVSLGGKRLLPEIAIDA